MKFTKTVEEIGSVNDDLQKQINTITKYFTFDLDGLTIGQEESPYKMVLDNDRLSMLINDEEVLWIDSITKEVHTPAITITDEMNLFGFTASQDSDGNVNWDYTE